jgi:hypothetical protein
MMMHTTRSNLSLAASLVLLAGCPADPSDTGASTTDSTGATTTDASTGAPTTTTTDTTGDTPTTGATGETGDSTTGEPLSRIDQILADLGVAMFACPERIWPDTEANYRASQVLLVSQLENTAWLWNNQYGEGEPPVVSKGPLDGLPIEWNAVFNIGELQGVTTLGISLDWTGELNDGIIAEGGTPWPDYATVLTFHEGFHFLSDQNDWNTGNGSRTAAYPEPWEPRYLRAALHRALLAELEGPGGELPAAAHWQQRLLAEHAAEMQASRSLDVTEGTAEYASLMMSALAELGCEATDEQLLDTALAHLHDGIFLAPDSFDPGREFYDLGVLAGLLLRRDLVSGWELAAENGAPPVEQILAGVEPAMQPDDPALQAEAQAAVAARNEQVGMEIEPLLDRMQDPAYTRMALDFNWIAGSFGVGGFYYLVDDPAQPEVLLRFDAVLDPPSGVTIEIKELTVLAGIDTPCALGPGPTIVVAVPTADLSVAGATATATARKLVFTDLEVEAAVDDMGLPWLCPTDAGGAGGPLPAPDSPHFHVLRPSARPGVARHLP